MAKILEFRRVEKKAAAREEAVAVADELEDDINAIMNDYSLTPANRRWLLENMLMEIDEQLEAYKKELERAEQKLNTVVTAAEQEIVAAYSEFEHKVEHMTRAVRKLTRTRRSQVEETPAISLGLPEQI